MDFYKNLNSDDEETVFRALSTADYTDSSLALTKNYNKTKFPEKQTETRKQSTFLPSVDDVQTLDRFVIFTTKDVEKVFAAVVTYIRTLGLQNDCVDEHNKSIVGYLFEESRCVHYRLQMFVTAEDCGLTCFRQEGDANILSEFWGNLVQQMENEAFTIPTEDVELDDEDDFFLEEDSDCGLDLESAKYLNLNQELVEEFIDDLQNPNFMQHTLLLLAFNVQNVSNMKLLKDMFAQQIFDVIIAVMTTTLAQVTLPMARSAARLMDKIINSTDVSVSEAQQAAILQTLDLWTQKDRKARNLDVKTSEEVATLITDNLNRIQKLSSMSIGTDILRSIADKTEFEGVRATLTQLTA